MTKKDQKEKNNTGPSAKRTLRDDAAERLARSPRASPDLNGQKTDDLIHELQVHQIELEMQAEELRRAHLTLEESRDQYLDLYEFAPLGYLTLTDKGLVIEANLTGATLLGQFRDKMVRSRFGKFVAESDSDKWHCYFMEVLGQNEKRSCTLTLRRGDGSEFTARLEAVRVAEPGKGRTAVRVAISDISDLKLMEDALRESEARYRALLDQAADAIIVNDREGRIIDVNQKACQTLGYSRKELLSRSIQDIDPDAIQTGVHLKLWDGVIAGSSFTFESRHKCKDGSSFLVEETIGPVRLPTGPAILAIVRDITERKRSEEALRLANKKLNLLSSITRHDMKNQMMSLEGHMSLLKMKRPEIASDGDVLSIEAATKRMGAMIRFTKEYENVGANSPIWQNVRALVQNEAQYIVQPPIKLVSEILASAEIYADPLIGKVFHNLMDNAVRHGKKITTLRFYLEVRDGSQVIICEDDGVGISPELKQGLFTHTSKDDHGFGLFLSREILAITGITIEERGEPGKGAKFVITIPPGGMKESS